MNTINEEPIIQYTDKFYAAYFPKINTVQIHKDLKLYDENLYNKAIKHELKHIGLNGIENLKHDLFDDFSLSDSIKKTVFYLKHPKMMWNMLVPFYFDRENDIFYINFSQIVYYVIIAILFTIYFTYF